MNDDRLEMAGDRQHTITFDLWQMSDDWCLVFDIEEWWLRMITYDGLRVLMMAEDDSRCCFGLFGPLFQPNIMRIRQGACFFIASLMVMLLDVEIPPKSRKITKN